MEGRWKNITDFFRVADALTAHARMKPAIVIAVPKCLPIVFRLGGKVGFEYNNLTKDGGEDISDGQRLEVYILRHACCKYYGELFEQVVWSNLFQKGVPSVQLARLEFTIRLKCKVRSSLMLSK
jgi:hypothetical protein